MTPIFESLDFSSVDDNDNDGDDDDNDNVEV